MKNFQVMTILAALWGTTCCGGGGIAQAQAAAPVFQCAACHAKTAEILPATHQKAADFSGCATCHAAGGKAPRLSGKIHAAHLAKGTVTAETCLGCHPGDAAGNMRLSCAGTTTVARGDLPELARKMATWLDSDKLAHVHRNNGVSCQACHRAYNEDDDESYSEKCIACHGTYDTLTARTAKTRFPRNPHKSHYPTLKCTNCHQSHDPFKDFCSTCHGFGFAWPGKK
ncbi:hypothetical protein FO488_13140 [Geobacter sp. FeAm09]|uniref:cytochrome c3 family protein n=1 Tax=Geobacter sp. FeAm09 TaxID=2597769 RepID=UPI0011EC465C|nr:cytochrome c3 family protein [Geobacter sp. FeAm09]QEM69010.1 hypothetical protein FO488_13140 [Geobacter sp. FeAm09]